MITILLALLIVVQIAQTVLIWKIRHKPPEFFSHRELEFGNEGMVDILDAGHKFISSRPVGHPDIITALNASGFSVRYPDGKVETGKT